MSPNTLATIAALAAALALVLSTRMIRPLGSAQPRHGAAWLDAHAVPAEARHYRMPVEPEDDEEADTDGPAEAADDTSPWAVPAVLATVPDALTIGGAA